jgi:DNA polymerase-3 subunit delta
MTFEQIISDLKSEKYAPIYFLTGDEPYYIDIVTNYISANILSEAEKSFNYSVFYGKDSDVPSIINAAKRFPMMAKYQVIIVKEAQLLQKFDMFIHYVEKPLDSTILVINYKHKKLDKRTKVYTALKKKAVILDSQKLYEDKIPGWITQYLKEKKISISAEGSAILTEFLGSDLNKIVNELSKLIITLPQGENKITPSHIERNIGISKDYNNFELQKALGQKNVLKVNQIIDHFAKNLNSNPFVLTVTNLYFYFSKLLMYHFLADKSSQNVASHLKINPYFVRDYQTAAKKYNTKKVVDIISYLREYDLKSKGVNNVSTTHGELLKELMFKILH